MNTAHRYTFEKGSKKHLCPECNKKTFVRYIDAQTGEYLLHQYGRCDRESKCGYFLNPYKDGYAKAIWKQEQGNQTDWKPTKVKRVKKVNAQKKSFFYPLQILKQTHAGYEQNTFIQNLLTKVVFPFEVQGIENVISLYYLGTIQNGYRKGATTFPFIDSQDNVRAIQVKQFDEQNHTTGTDFLHSIIEKYHSRNNTKLPDWLEAYNKNELKVTCLFGEHLLKRHPHNPVALVEAPKTAIYGTLYFGFPDEPTNLLWLAVYNLSSLNLNKCKALKGRDVFLFPDLSKDGKAFELWNKKATEIQKQLQGSYFQVSNLLEKLAPQQDKEQGKDLADYLIKQDWRLFRKQDVKEAQKSNNKIVEVVSHEKNEKCEAPKKSFFQQLEPTENDEVLNAQPQNIKQTQNWQDDISELETYFANIQLPTQPIKLKKCSTIGNCSLFIQNHLATIKANNGNPAFLPYLSRLQEFKNVISYNG